jgi:putative ABC transport system permease protein
MGTLLQDIRYGLRMLVKNPVFTVVAVVTLALGIGGNAAMFSIVNALLLRALPYAEPHRLVRVTGYYPKGALVALQQETQTMDVAGFTSESEFNLTGQGEAVRLVGSAVSADLFSVLGVGTELGRTFSVGDDQPGRDRLVVLSNALWKGKFGGDPNILGRVITLEGVDRQVVGVMPPDFGFPSPRVQFWMPLHLDSGNTFDFWNTGFMPVVGRLRPGASLAQARNEIRPLIAHIIRLFPYTMAPNWNADATVIPLQQDLIVDIRDKLILLQCAIGLVLLIACANVANLLLSRATVRQKEMAVRTALGASQARLVRQLLTESVVLALVGGGLGLAVSWNALAILKLALPINTPGWPEIGIDWRVFIFVAGIAVVAGALSGLAPAVTGSRLDLAAVYKSAGRRSAGTVGIRLRGALIAGEVGLAVLLAVSAGLLLRSLWLLMRVDPGFRPERILTVRVSPNPSVCRSRSECIALYDELLRRARESAGISEAAAINAIPLGGQVPAVPVELEEHPLVPSENLAPILWAGAVTPGYFQLMRIPVLRGQTFSDAMGEKSEAVVVVSAATARRFWPGEDPIGKHLRVVWETNWRTVVGVVGDVRQFDLANQSPDWINGAVYMPYPQSVGLDGNLPTSMTLLVRTSGDSHEIESRIRELVNDLNPNVPVSEFRTMDAVVVASTSQPRSLMWLFLSFAAAALVLAAIGTYGVVSYTTAQRTFEIGVRVALGASRGSIFGLVIGQSLELVIAGIGLGAVAALALGRLLSSYLYGITPQDPLTFLAVAGMLVGIALAAGFLPARRATKVDPIVALRYE